MATVLTRSTKGGFVIEFQHSSISLEAIAAREGHWRKGVWVLDGTDGEAGRRVFVMAKPDQDPQDPWRRYRWPRPPGLLFRAKWPCWIDLGGQRGLLQVYNAGQGGGNGWLVKHDWFVAEVLNGGRATLRQHKVRRPMDAPQRRRSTARPELESDLAELVQGCERPALVMAATMAEFPPCDRCGRHLLAPISQQRGYCEACRMAQTIDRGAA